MSVFDLGSTLGVIEFGGSEEAARQYVEWVEDTRGGIASECGALALDEVVEAMPQELGDYGVLIASGIGSSSM